MIRHIGYDECWKRRAGHQACPKPVLSVLQYAVLVKDDRLSGFRPCARFHLPGIILHGGEGQFAIGTGWIAAQPLLRKFWCYIIPTIGKAERCGDRLLFVPFDHIDRR